jgi:hypothetical protein
MVRNNHKRQIPEQDVTSVTKGNVLSSPWPSNPAFTVQRFIAVALYMVTEGMLSMILYGSLDFTDTSPVPLVCSGKFLSCTFGDSDRGDTHVKITHRDRQVILLYGAQPSGLPLVKQQYSRTHGLTVRCHRPSLMIAAAVTAPCPHLRSHVVVDVCQCATRTTTSKSHHVATVRVPFAPSQNTVKIIRAMIETKKGDERTIQRRLKRLGSAGSCTTIAKGPKKNKIEREQTNACPHPHFEGSKSVPLEELKDRLEAGWDDSR